MNGTVRPSAILRKLGAYRQQNRFYLALAEMGRVERTLFMLDWIESPKLRMATQGGLCKGEAEVETTSLPLTAVVSRATACTDFMLVLGFE